jgi:hypothetical protein
MVPPHEARKILESEKEVRCVRISGVLSRELCLCALMEYALLGSDRIVGFQKPWGVTEFPRSRSYLFYISRVLGFPVRMVFRLILKLPLPFSSPQICLLRLTKPK